MGSFAARSVFFLGLIGVAGITVSCGGSDDPVSSSADPAAQVDAGAATDADATGATDAPIDPTDLEAASAMTPVDRERVSLDGLEFLFTSYCGEQIGNGVEILVLGLEPLEMFEFEIDGNSAFVQAIDERPGIQYISSTEPVYVIELPGESGTTVVELDGCE